MPLKTHVEVLSDLPNVTLAGVPPNPVVCVVAAAAGVAPNPPNPVVAVVAAAAGVPPNENPLQAQ